MNLKKIIISFTILTAFGLLYVHLQTKIIELGYEVKEQEHQHTRLLDHNKILVYNINKLCSPFNLGQSLSSDEFDYKIVNSYRKVKLVSLAKRPQVASEKGGFLSYIFDLLTPAAQAEAFQLRANKH